jgi:hypothetical protein
MMVKNIKKVLVRNIDVQIVDIAYNI